MTRMPVFRTVESDILLDMIQAQEQKLSRVRRDDHWDVWQRKMGSRRKHLGTSDLPSASREKLKVYFIHLVEKEMEIIQ